jgi:hypothetical protein
MKKRLLMFALLLSATMNVCAFAREHDRGGGDGSDDLLIQASDCRRWVGHQQSERSFITCFGTAVTIEQGDKVKHGGVSCEGSRAALRAGVQRAVSLYVSLEWRGLVSVTDAYGVGKYALASWTGEGGKTGKAVLVDDGTAWHVLSFGRFDEREALARGVPREVVSDLLAAK